MKISRHRVRKAYLAGAGIAALLAGAPAALAQDAADQAAEQQTPATDDADRPQPIVVTGSRIPRAGFDTPQPALVIDSEHIEQRGYTNVADALSELPAFGVPGNSRVGTQTGSIGAGQSFVNFFGLGTQRTLTLINGRRFVSSNTASVFGPVDPGSQVDLNTIPTKLLERIETIAVGGAPIYGSDAIAGTINILLKRDFEGIDLDAQYGIAELGDAADYRLRGLFGTNFAGGRGNITLSLEYNESEGLLYTDREATGRGYFFSAPIPGTSDFRNILITDRRIPGISATGVPLVADFFPLSPRQIEQFGFNPNVYGAGGGALVFNPAGELVPLDFGEDTGSVTNFSGGDGFSLLPVQNLLSPTRRYLGTALAQYELTDNLRVFGEAWYANSRGTELRAQPVYNTGLFDVAGAPDGNLIIPLSNPFLSPAARAVIEAAIAANPDSGQNAGGEPQDYFYLGRANTDLTSGLGSAEIELYRFVAGIDGTFDVGDRTFNFELVGNYGRSETNGESRELVQQNFLNAINAVRDASGNIVCAPGAVNSPVQTISDTCAPINPFGSNISQAARDYVTTIARPRSANDQKVVTASVSGDLFDLPGGGVGFALGYEHREESADFDPGFFFAGTTDEDGEPVSFGRSVPFTSVSGRFNTDEVFGELRVPIVGPAMNVPLVERLELNGAARYVDQSLAGGDWTYTVGAEWAPIGDITFRGNYTRSIRNPAVAELFTPESGLFTTAEDPCDARFLGSGPDPATRQANCAADGLPADFVSNIVDFTSRGSLAGDPDLENERADSYTFGAVLRPRFLPGFTASVDWVDIRLKNAIISLDADQVLQACYDATEFPSAQCSRFDRNEDGQITFIRTGYANAASFDYRGLVAQIDYTVATPLLHPDSQVNVGASYQYLDKLEQRVGLGDLTTLRSAIGYSKHKGTANVTWGTDAFAWQVQAQYFGPAERDPDASPGTYEYPTVQDVVFINSALSTTVDERLTLRLIVDNVFDQAAPFPTVPGNGDVVYFSGILGRSFKFGASVSF